MNNKDAISEKTLGRLCVYRRLLNNLKEEGIDAIYSHELADMAGGSAAQVRRDLMSIGYSGSPTKGYNIEELARSIGSFIDAPEG
ncbi:MAG: redox-sensing transcriptional repressor Rex, partial [Planctomycetes bacterium]|nr:redox-sensing transcriptional repressor Rex [Planctomycetota bacterium]